MPKFWNKSTQGTLWGGASTLIKALGHWMLIKALATYFGPEGVSLHAQVVNLITIFMILPQQGIGLGLVKLLPEHQNKGSILWKTALYLGLGLVAIVGSLLLLAQATAVFQGIGIPLGGYWWLVFACCILGFLFQQIFLFLLQALQEFRLFAILATIGSVTSAGIAWGLGNYSLEHSLLALPLGLILSSAVALVVAYSQSKKKTASHSIISIPHILKHSTASIWTHARLFVPFLMLALTTWASSGIIYGIRSYSIQEIGLVQTSYWQAPFTLSTYYVTAFSTTVIFVFYPTLTKKIASRQSVYKLMLQASAAVALLLCVALGFIYWGKEWLIPLLFAESLKGAIPLMGVQLCGDFFGLLSLLAVHLLLALGKARVLVGYQILMGIIQLVAVYILFDSNPLFAVPNAYLLKHIFGFFFLTSAISYSLWSYEKSLKVHS